MMEHEEEPHGGGSLREVIITVLLALGFVVLVTGYVVKPYRIPSGSMENTLKCQDRILVDRTRFHFRDIERGDVIVFRPPARVTPQGKVEPQTVASNRDAGMVISAQKQTRKVYPADFDYVKRVVGLPGEKLEVRGHHVVINGKQILEPYLHPIDSQTTDATEDFGPITVPKGTLFLMGDNRENSSDGRVFGPVPESFVIGKAMVIYWPLRHMGTLPEREANGPDARKPDPNCLEAAGFGI